MVRLRLIQGCAVALLVAVAGLVAASTLAMVVQCAVPVPILDQWAQLVGRRTVTLAWLVSQHNEHRLLFPRLVFLADRWLAAETGQVSLAASVAAQGGLAVVLLRLGRGTGVRGWYAAAVAAAGVAGLLAWAVQYENYTWPFQVQFFGVLLAASGCFAAVAGSASRRGLAAAATLGFVASFTLSSGMLAPFFATALAVWLRRPRWYQGALGLAAMATLGLYLIGYRTPDGHGDPLQALAQPWAVLTYAAAVLGSPLASAVGVVTGAIDPAVAVVAGLCGGGLLVLLGLQRRGGARDPSAAALLAVCLFVLATALLTAAGRMRFGIASALASRYATPALVFWAALLLLGLGRLHRRPAYAAALVATVLALVAGTQGAFTHTARQLAANRTIALPALVVGVADAQLIAPIYPDPDVPLRFRLTEFDSRTGPFAQRWAPWIGTPLADHTRPATGCEGSFDGAVGLPDAAYPGWRVTGTLEAPSIKHGRQVVALTDPAGRIAGFGISDAGATTLAAAGPGGEPPRTGWVGAATGTDPAQLRAFVLLDAATAACPLHGPPRIVAAVQVALSGPAPGSTPAGGSIDAVYGDAHVTVDGWALVQTNQGAPGLHVDTNLPVQSATIAAVARPDAAAAFDDARLAQAGFRIVLTLEPGAAPPAAPHLCIWSNDAVFGTRRLTMNPATPAQARLCP